MHIPKTGSTFGLSIYLHACQHLPASITLDDGPPIVSLTRTYPADQYCEGGFVDPNRLNGHQPAKWPDDAGRLVTLFREPLGHKLSFLRYAHEDQIHGVLAGVFWKTMLGRDGSDELSPDEYAVLDAFVGMNGVTSNASNPAARCNFLRLVLPRLRGRQAKMLSGGLGCLSHP